MKAAPITIINAHSTADAISGLRAMMFGVWLAPPLSRRTAREPRSAGWLCGGFLMSHERAVASPKSRRGGNGGKWPAIKFNARGFECALQGT